MSKQSICLTKEMLDTPEFKALQEQYPDYDGAYLLDALVAYREQYCEGRDDYYPVSPGQRGAFTRFLRRVGSQNAPVKMKSEMTTQELLDTYVSLSKAFSPRVRELRIGMIVSGFIEKIRWLLQERPGLTVEQAIAAFGGYERIMNSVFDEYKDMSSLDYLLEENPIEAEEGTPEYEKAMEAYRVTAYEYDLVVQNRKRLIALAAPRLSAILGMRINMGTLVAQSDIDEVVEVQPSSDSPENNQGTEGEEESENLEMKGDRYEDVRKKVLAQTITARLKIFLEGVPLLDGNGNPQTDDLGNELYLGYETVASALSGEFQSVEAEDFMDALLALSSKYPWTKTLYEAMDGNLEIQADMFSNLKTYEHKLKSIRSRGKKYEMEHLNRRSNHRSVMQEAGKNMVDGHVLNWEYTVYDGSGALSITSDKAKKIKEKLSKKLTEVGHVKTKTTSEPYSERFISQHVKDEPWVALRGKDAMQAFLDSEGVDEWLDVVVGAAQGLGMSITKDNVKAMAVKSIDKITARREGFRSGNNRLEIFVKALLEAYDNAVDAVNRKEDTNYFYSVSESAFNRLTDSLALALTKETESRVHVGDSSVATNTTAGFLYWLCDKLFNHAGLSRTAKAEGSHLADDGETYVPNVTIGDYEKWMQKNFFDYEGFILESTGKPIGWLRDLMDARERIEGYDGAMSKYKGPTAIVNQVQFNGVPYEKLSDDQRRLAAFMMWYSVGKGATGKQGNYAMLIQSDYTAAWDYIQAPIYETGTTVHDLAVEIAGDPDSDQVEGIERRLRARLGSDRAPVKFTLDGKTRYSEIVYRFADEVRLEHERILLIEARENEPHVKLKTYEQEGKKFLIFPEFQENGFREKYEQLLEEDVDKANEFLYDQVAQQLMKILSEDIAEFTSGDIPKSTQLPSTKYENMFDDKGNLTPYGYGLFQQFSLNDYYARVQMANIFFGGIAHLKNISALEKRSMFLHATRSAMYTVAGKKDEQVAYIADDETKSAVCDQMKALIRKALSMHLISKDRADAALAAYDSIKQTDGQGFRTLESYREFRRMNPTSQWTEAHEEAYQRIQSGNIQPGDLDLMFEGADDAYNGTIKPIASGWESASTLPGQKPVRVPLLHKYSEAVLLPPTLLGSSFTMQSAQLQAFNRLNAMLEKAGRRKYDLFLFESNVKIAPFSVLDPFQVDEKTGERVYKTADEMAQYMYDTVTTDPSYAHVVSYDFVGVSASMPAHGSDTRIAFSTQAEKQTLANIEHSKSIRVPGHEFSGKESRDKYDEIECAIIADSFQEVVAELKDSDGVGKLLREELGSKQFNSPEIASMLTPVRDGKGNVQFAVPIFSPTTSKKAQEMLGSIMNHRLAKIYTRGAGLVQVSSLGMDQESVPFTQDGFLRDDRDRLGINFREDENGNVVAIDSLDCFVVIPKSLEMYAEPDGSIPPWKLRKLVHDDVIDKRMLMFYGYRTPSDAEHSTLPLRIKGFLPPSAGSSIIIGKEAMVMTGHDYDGDKFRCHFQEYRVTTDYDRMRRDYRDNPTWADPQVLEDLFGEELKGVASDNYVDEEEFMERVKHLPKKNKFKQRYATTHLIEYDFSKSPFEGKNTDPKARRNALIQILIGALTSESGSMRMIIPGGAQETDKLAKTFQIMKMLGTHYASTSDILIAAGFPEEILAKKDYVAIYNRLLSMPAKKRDAILDDVNSSETPFSFAHQCRAYRYMMTGTQMTGIYAMYSSTAALLQRLHLRYMPKQRKGGPANPRLFGKAPDDMFKIQYGPENDKDPLQLLILAELVNAAVDNGKNPILGFLNQTPELASMTFFLYSIGLSAEEIHLVMNQPCMIELANRLKSRDSKGFKIELYRMITELKEMTMKSTDKGFSFKIAIDNFAKVRGTDKYVLGLLQKYSDLKEPGHKEEAIFNLGLLCTLHEFADAAAQLTTFVHVVRPESRSAGAGPTIAKTIVRLQEAEDLSRLVVPKESEAEDEDRDDKYEELRISGMEPVLRERDIYEGMSSDKIVEEIQKDVEKTGQLRQAVAHNHLLVRYYLNFCARYFPQAKEDWVDYTVRLAKEYDYASLQDGIVESIGEEMILYALLDSEHYRRGLEERRRDLIVDMPLRLSQLQDRINAEKTRDPEKEPKEDTLAKELSGNVFLLKLGVHKPEGEKDAPRVYFDAGGPMIGHMAEDIRQAWADLMEHPNKEIRKLAVDLFEYNLFTSGFGFGRYEFAHLAPLNVLLRTPRYVDSLYSVMSYKWDDEKFENFRHQYYMNHWGERRLVPHFRLEDLSAEALQILGIQGIPNTSADAVSADLLQAFRYVVIEDKDDNQNLYRQVDKVDANGKKFEDAQKTGVRKANGQMSLLYSPQLSFRDIKPVQVGLDSNWGDERALANNAPRRKKFNRSKTADAQFKAGVDASVEKRLNSEAPKMPPPPAILTEGMREDAEKKNEKMGGADKENGSLPADSIEAKLKKTDGPKFYHLLQRDAKGNPVVREVPVTPGNTTLARRQRVQVELNRRLRDILKRHGIGVGALTDADIRMGIAGVSDFDTAEVTANGLIDLIRLAHGYTGEQALPEEFAHVALEMLGHDHPLVQRLLSAVGRSDAGLREAFEGQYDDYLSAYEGNRSAMVVEAAGKLVAKHLLRQQKIETNFLYRIVARVSDAIKALFRMFSVNEVHNAIYDANQVASRLARNMLSGRISDEMRLENIRQSGKLYKADKIKEDISAQDGILSKLLKFELKRLNHLETRIQDRDDDPAIEATKGQIAALRDSIRRHKTDAAVLSYLDSTYGFLLKTEQELNATLDHELEIGTNRICKYLTNIIDTVYGFQKALLDIKQAIKDGEISSSPSLTELIQQIETSLQSFYDRCNGIGMEYFEDFLSDVYGEEGLTQTIGRNRGRHISIKEIATRGDKDLSIFSRWLHSLADCDDLVLKAVSEKVARAKYDARSKTLEIKRDVDVAFAKLVRETGSRDQSFMFEMKRYDGGSWCGGRQDDGKLHKTGKFITREEAKKTLSSAQFEFYDAMRKIKEKADKLLPDSKVSPRKIIMLRKKAIEKAMDSDNVKSKAKYVFEEIRDKFLDMSDDAMSDTYEVQMGFDGSRVDRLPILYCEKSPRETFDDMTDDVATSVMAYVSMANEYSELDNIVGMIENARRMSSMRDIGQRSGLRQMQETISDEEQIFRSPYTVKQAVTRVQQALDDYVTMHVYGHIRKDEGNIPHTRISKRALVDSANSLASLSQMALNLSQRVANVTVGQAQIIIESAAKGMFRAKDVRWAAAQYAKYGGDRLMEVGKIDSDNFLTLWIDHFDVGQDNRRSFKQDKYGRSKLGRKANSGVLYAGLTIGEDYLSTVTSLALARQFQVKHREGNKDVVTHLADAYEVAYTDPVNKTGAYLKVKEGYTKMDGSPITKEDEYRFARQVNALNFDMQGIYNLDDRSAIQQYCGGALLIMYRKWIAPALKRRYANTHYDALRGQWEQGYWTTTASYIYDTIISVKEDNEKYLSAISLNWNKLTPYEKGNIRKAVTELGIIMGTCLLIGALDLLEEHRKQVPDDDEPLSWYEKQVLYQALRLRNELGAQAPTHMLLSEAGKILKNPVAAARPLVTVIDAYHLLLPSSYFETIQSGKYRGHSKAYKYFWDLPGLNMVHRIESLKDPSYQIRYYENGY